MSLTATLASIGLSLAGVGWLNATDPKRRRAFGLSPLDGARSVRAAWALVLAPGGFVPFASGGAGFVIWFGATSVFGWALVAVPPGAVRPPRGLAALDTARRRWTVFWSMVATGAVKSRAVDALEARVARIEAELAELRLRIEQNHAPGSDADKGAGTHGHAVMNGL